MAVAVVVVVLQTRGNKNLHHEVYSSVAENIASWLLMFKSLRPLASCQAASRARRKCQSLGRSEVIGGPKKRGAAAAAAAALDNRERKWWKEAEEDQFTPSPSRPTA